MNTFNYLARIDVTNRTEFYEPFYLLERLFEKHLHGAHIADELSQLDAIF